jgi:hypothetical protein
LAGHGGERLIVLERAAWSVACDQIRFEGSPKASPGVAVFATFPGSGGQKRIRALPFLAGPPSMKLVIFGLTISSS